MPSDAKLLAKPSNLYDKLLIFFIVLQILGELGGALQPIRVFVLLGIPVMFLHYVKNIKELKAYKWLVLLFVLWELIGFISLFWVKIPTESLKDLIYLFVGFSAFFLVIFLSEKANSPQESIIKGWNLFFIITIPIALVELSYDIHLPMVSAQKSGLLLNGVTESVHRSFATITFYNLNGYNLKSCYVLPFLLCLFFQKNSKSLTILYCLEFVILLYIVAVNASRGAFLAIFIGSVFFLFFSLKRKAIIRILGIFSLSFLLFLHPSIQSAFKVILTRFKDGGFTDPIRMELLEKGSKALVDSRFIGIGAGNFAPFMKEHYNLSTLSPHNLFLEIGVQYGLIILVYFIALLCVLLFQAKKNPLKRNRFIVYMSFLILPLISIIDSGYLLGVSVWLFGASLFVISNSKFNIS